MSLMPFHIPKLALHGLIAFGTAAAGVYCLVKAFERRRPGVKDLPLDEPYTDLPLDEPYTDPSEIELGRPVSLDVQDTFASDREQADVVPWRLGLREAGLLLAGLGLIGWSLGGGRSFILSRRHGSGIKPKDGEDRRVQRPDGTQLHVECYGPADGAPILFVHGLGSDCDEWFEIRQRLVAGGHRIVDWDLPGLGESTPPGDGDWSMERLAGDLEAVLEATCERPAVLLGHSLGGMVLLTFCRLFPESLQRRVAGLVLAHTTYTDPMKTNAYAGLSIALQKPLVEPLCHLMIGVSSLVWPLSVLTYLSGEAHRSLGHSLFTGGESREVLDFLADYFVDDRPESVARYTLAMLRYDETATLGAITVPTLVVVGDQDDSCTPETHEYMREHIPGARLLTLSPAKHGGLLEHPQQFTEALMHFAARCAAPKAQPVGR